VAPAYTFPAFALSRPSTTDLRRFFSYVRATHGGCWTWVGAINGKGYPVYRSTSAHRFAYAWFVAPIAAGLTIDHLCRNRACVNPVHLDACSDAENKRRASTFNRLGRCRRRGHVLAEVGIELGSNGERACAECHRLARARYVLRKNGAYALPDFAVAALTRERRRHSISAKAVA